jgi:transcriptional regulator with XRE-family HTH domain
VAKAEQTKSEQRQEGRRRAFGEFIRNQRAITKLSLRQLANLAQISNPYLSQVERGVYEPSAAILSRIADALGIPAEKLFKRAGFLDEDPADGAVDVEAAIRLDERLTPDQRETLLRVYRGFVGEPVNGA